MFMCVCVSTLCPHGEQGNLLPQLSANVSTLVHRFKKGPEKEGKGLGNLCCRYEQLKGLQVFENNLETVT